LVGLSNAWGGFRRSIRILVYEFEFGKLSKGKHQGWGKKSGRKGKTKQRQ